MKFTTAKASDLDGRWDAGFHLALAEVRERVEALRLSVTPEEARARLASLPVETLAPIFILKRVGTGGVTPAAAERIVAEYPHLSLAIMERNLRRAIDDIKAEIGRNQDLLARLVAIGRERSDPAGAALSDPDHDPEEQHGPCP